MKLIVGLGNPGEKYSKTRHNLGFRTLDDLVKKLDIGSGLPAGPLRREASKAGKLETEVESWKLDSKFKSYILHSSSTTSTTLSTGSLTAGAQDDSSLLFVKPQTYMNNSGLAVKLLTSHFSLLTSDIIVVHDDLDLMLGKIKVRMGGAAGGHHGVESVINTLGTDQFIRVRLGIGNERSHSGEHNRAAFNAEHFVLEPFMPNERSKVKHMIKQAVGALEILLDRGLEVAQNQFN